MRGARAGGGSGGGGPEEAVPLPRIAPSRPSAVTHAPRRVLTSRCVLALGGSRRTPGCGQLDPIRAAGGQASGSFSWPLPGRACASGAAGVLS